MTLSDIKCCVIIPTYNNVNTLKHVIESVLPYTKGSALIAINDGSKDGTMLALSSFGHKVRVMHNSHNKGKGFALRRGFEEAWRLGFRYAITMDSDGQHLADDIPTFIDAIVKNPDSVIMGSRNMEQDGVPRKSSFGNKFSNFWFKFETGIDLPDTQTGFRLYPIDELQHIELVTSKFETEIEVIVKLAWRGVPIIPVNIDVVYDMKERVSHFRPLVDFTRISILNLWLVFLTLIYHLPKRLIVKAKKKGTVEHRP